MNQINTKGQTYDFTEANLKTAVDALISIPCDGLVKTNEQVFDLLTLGKPIEQTIDGNNRSYTLQYIDWEHPEKNSYHNVVNDQPNKKTALRVVAKRLFAEVEAAGIEPASRDTSSTASTCLADI